MIDGIARSDLKKSKTSVMIPNGSIGRWRTKKIRIIVEILLILRSTFELRMQRKLLAKVREQLANKRSFSGVKKLLAVGN